MPLALSNKNPTIYTFNSNTIEVRKVIKLNFSILEFKGMSLAFFEDNNPFSKDIFKNPVNKNDAYLYSFDLFNSSIYYKDSKPLLYSASFHIHLDSIDNNHTTVTINTIHPKVLVGKKFGLRDNLRIRTADFRDVEPSTVEEYEILLKIGTAIDEKDMPKLIMPEKQTISKKKQK
jgi:hypothetical protein